MGSWNFGKHSWISSKYSYTSIIGYWDLNYVRIVLLRQSCNEILEEYKMFYMISGLKKKVPYICLVFDQSYLCKQYRPRSDTTGCGIWSGSALFATHPTVFRDNFWVVIVQALVWWWDIGPIKASGKALFSTKKYRNFSYFSTKTYVMVLIALLMNTHNISFHGE